MRVALVLLAACVLPDEKVAGNNFTCAGQTPPSTADDSITLAGTITDPANSTPVGNATVVASLQGGSASLFTITSNPDGSFTHDQRTGGSPLDLFLQIDAASFVEGLFYPARPIAHSLTEDVQMFTSGDLANIGQLGGLSIDPTQAQVLVVVEDCDGNPVPGATVTTDPPGAAAIYFGQTDGSQVTGGSGAVLMANVMPGQVEVDADLGETLPFHGHMVGAPQNAVVEVEVQP